MSLLSVHVPGGFEMLSILLILFVVASLVGGWVYRDAKSRGSSRAWQWGVGIGVLLLANLIPGLLALLVYMRVRGERVEPTS